MTSRVAIVVPTLGRREEYLRKCLVSIRAQSVPADIVIVGPDSAFLHALVSEFSATWLPDPGGLPAAINLGVASVLDSHDYVNWLGDDDLLEPGSLAATVGGLDSHPDASVAFGACRYIDDDGRELWISRAGVWGTRVLSWGPDLIPQPGMLVRSSAWRAIGGLDTSYTMAFDLDLLLRLRRIGPLVDVGQIVSSFRWHRDSLTVDNRDRNLAESERAKRAALGPVARRCAWMWERPVRLAIMVAAREVHRRAAKSTS